MKRFDDKNYWLKKIEVKEMCSDKGLVEKMIVDIGKDIINKMMLEKYNQLVINSNK